MLSAEAPHDDVGNPAHDTCAQAGQTSAIHKE